MQELVFIFCDQQPAHRLPFSATFEIVGDVCWGSWTLQNIIVRIDFDTVELGLILPKTTKHNFALFLEHLGARICLRIL